MSAAAQFDPDAFMAARSSPPAFDPDAFMAGRAQAQAQPEQSFGAAATEYGHKMAEFGRGLWDTGVSVAKHLLPGAGSDAPADIATAGIRFLANHHAQQGKILSDAEDAAKNGDWGGFFRNLQAWGINSEVPGFGAAVKSASDKWDAGDKAGAIADGAALVTQQALIQKGPAIARGVASVPSRIADAAGTAADLVTSPAARDVAGLLSPRAAHALSVAQRIRKAFTGAAPAEDAVEPYPTPSAPSGALAVNPEAAPARPAPGVNVPIRPPMRSGAPSVLQMPAAAEPEAPPVSQSPGTVPRPASEVPSTTNGTQGPKLKPAESAEYQQMLRTSGFSTDPGTYPGAKPGASIADSFTKNARSQVAPTAIRTFPADQLPALAQHEGISVQAAYQRLKAAGWLVPVQ